MQHPQTKTEFVCWDWRKLNRRQWLESGKNVLFFFILLLLKTTITAQEWQRWEPPRRFTVDGDDRSLPISVIFMHTLTCVQMRRNRFSNELFARKTLRSVVLDLCTQRAQTQTDMARLLFSPGAVSVSEMKRTANTSCLLHCRYYSVSVGADAWTAVRGSVKHTLPQSGGVRRAWWTSVA